MRGNILLNSGDSGVSGTCENFRGHGEGMYHAITNAEVKA